MRDRTLATVAAIALQVLAGLWLSSCTDGRPPESAPYFPVFAQTQGTGPASAPGTLSGDFEWAASSATLAEAEMRWTEFLRAHRASDGDYEDAFAIMRVESAEWELLRVEYLLGKSAEGDRRLRRMDPLGIGGRTPQ